MMNYSRMFHHGDKTDLQALEKVQGVRILTLREFVEMMT